MQFSVIIPVYNRPNEVEELLSSFEKSVFKDSYEIIIVEDGSTNTCENIVKKYDKTQLDISYYYKENTGPGDSRNFGMKKARGDYYIILDSDCTIHPNYLEEVKKELDKKQSDCFGGPDCALPSFSSIQKAVNFAMTSFLTTGGIRGGSEKLTKFQPRSFNMGLSKKAFEATNGFSDIHPGEDPELTFRLWDLGYKTHLFPKVYVYHKRRIDWESFSVQVNKFGKVRPILNTWYPKYARLSYFFPSLFIIGFVVALFLIFLNSDILLQIYFTYFCIVFIVSSYQYKNIKVGYLSVVAVWKQFWGYGLGFLESFFKISVLKQNPRKVFPELFFEKKI